MLDTNTIINRFNQINLFGSKNYLLFFYKNNRKNDCNNCELQKFGFSIIKTNNSLKDSINLLADNASWKDIKNN